MFLGFQRDISRFHVSFQMCIDCLFCTNMIVSGSNHIKFCARFDRRCTACCNTIITMCFRGCNNCLLLEYFLSCVCYTCFYTGFIKHEISKIWKKTWLVPAEAVANQDLIVPVMRLPVVSFCTSLFEGLSESIGGHCVAIGQGCLGDGQSWRSSSHWSFWVLNSRDSAVSKILFYTEDYTHISSMGRMPKISVFACIQAWHTYIHICI